MKILLMGFTKIKYMPYINFYLDNFSKSNDIHIVYWNRDGKDEDLSSYKYATFYEFSSKQKDDVSPFLKIKNFLKYKRFVKKILLEDEFDFIICLHTFPAFLLSNILISKYRNRYIFDYRDYTYEKFGFFKKKIADIVKNSEATFVSSDAFRQFLPESEKDKIYTTHNILVDSMNHRDDKSLYGTKSSKIRIAFWGFIRHENINRDLIRIISSDDRFELHYYGREQQVALNLKKYATELNAKNIFFHGEYKPEDRYEFVRNTDIIHNIYDDNNMRNAMGNKYYDGAIFRLPQICLEGSYMAKCCEDSNIGFSCDIKDENFLDDLYTNYTTLQFDKFRLNCDIELDRVMNEYKFGCEFISRLIDNK